MRFCWPARWATAARGLASQDRLCPARRRARNEALLSASFPCPRFIAIRAAERQFGFCADVLFLVVSTVPAVLAAFWLMASQSPTPLSI